jgi:DNA-directed RNA polymerase specialized sigma24 family protein
LTEPRIQTSKDLHRLSDEDLLAHMRQARDRGDLDSAKRALQILVFGYLDHVRARVALKVPEHVVDDVAGHALLSAVAGAFRGGSVGEFRSWLHVIVDRRVADYHRAGKLELVPLDDHHEAIAARDDEAEAIVVCNVIEAALGELSDLHRSVIDLYVFDGLSAAETARELASRDPDGSQPVNADNVHKIAQRFRERVRGKLEAAGG